MNHSAIDGMVLSNTYGLARPVFSQKQDYFSSVEH